MAPKVIPTTITAEQAATGVVIPIRTRQVDVTFQIPPCSNGDLIPAYLGGHEVLLRIVIVKDRKPPSRRAGLVFAGLCVVAFLVALALTVLLG